jgi:hypothetical protein
LVALPAEKHFTAEIAEKMRARTFTTEGAEDHGGIGSLSPFLGDLGVLGGESWDTG